LSLLLVTYPHGHAVERAEFRVFVPIDSQPYRIGSRVHRKFHNANIATTQALSERGKRLVF
jgi:hypothetical protein